LPSSDDQSQQCDRRQLETVEFPSGAPRDGCIQAVVATCEYIHEHGEASQTEIFEDLVPEEEYPIGVNGALAEAKGLTPGFRQWWWEKIVAPGLHALPDVEPVTTSETHWQPTE